MLSVAVLALALFPLPMAAAGASPQAEDNTAKKTVTTIVATEPDDDPTTASVCHYTQCGYTGNVICGFSITSVNHGNGNIEYYAVGANYAIYHIWAYSSGWRSLGGQARTAAPNGAWGSFLESGWHSVKNGTPAIPDRITGEHET